MNDATMTQEDFAVRCQRLLTTAKQVYGANPDWVSFFREILGITGKARQLFRDQAEYVAFERTTEFQEIQNMVNALRNRRIPSATMIHEPTRVITVRLPESLHEALKQEASDHQTSMNKLCISKLLQVLNEQEREQNSRMGNMGANRSTSLPVPQSATPSFRSTYNSQPGPNSMGGMGTR